MAAVPKEPLLNASIELDDVDMSKTANEVTIKDTAAVKDVSTFQGGDYTEETVGLKTADANIQVFQDYTEGSVHATCAPIYRENKRVILVVKADDAEPAADNPAWIMAVRLTEYQPIGAKVGEPQAFSIPMKNASSLGLKEATSKEELETLKGEFEEELGIEEEEEGGSE